jgi:hypothetical protein
MKLAPDWNRIAADDARQRAGFPGRFYDRMTERGLFHKTARILDFAAAICGRDNTNMGRA